MTTTKEAGKKGGNKTFKKYGKKHYSKIAKDAWEKRKLILRAFTIGEILNPITHKSIKEKLEQIDNLNKN